MAAKQQRTHDNQPKNVWERWRRDGAGRATWKGCKGRANKMILAWSSADVDKNQNKLNEATNWFFSQPIHKKEWNPLIGSSINSLQRDFCIGVAISIISMLLDPAIRSACITSGERIAQQIVTNNEDKSRDEKLEWINWRWINCELRVIFGLI